MEKIVSYAKKVTMLELFYDLVYVLAVQKTTGIIHHLQNGRIGLEVYMKFMLVCAVLLLMWFSETIYINKYSEDSRWDKVGLLLHMFGVIFITNNIGTNWDETFIPFNVTAIGMTVVVMVQYAIKGRNFKDIKPIMKDIKTQIAILIMEVVGLVIAICSGAEKGIWIACAVYILAMITPTVLKAGRTDVGENPINFPHLVERVSLITIIIFGEMVVGVAGTFKSNGLGILEIVVFATVGLLFYTYWLVIEELVDNRQRTRGFLLRYSHIGIFIGLSMITVCFSFHLNEVNWQFLVFFRQTGLCIFYASLLGVAKYNKEKYPMTKRNAVGYLGTVVLISALTLLVSRNNQLLLNCIMFVNVSIMVGYIENYKLYYDRKSLKKSN